MDVIFGIIQFLLSSLMLSIVAFGIVFGIAFIAGMLRDKSKIAKTLEDGGANNYISIWVIILILLIIINFLIASSNDWDFYYLISLFK